MSAMGILLLHVYQNPILTLTIYALYIIPFDIMKYFQYFLTFWHTFWPQHIYFDVMKYSSTYWRPFDFMTYLLSSWHTFPILLCHGVLVDAIRYLLTSWRYFVLSILFEVMTYPWRHNVVFDLMAYFPYFLASWPTSWRHGLSIVVMSYLPYS